jgi:hypothetical protein
MRNIVSSLLIAIGVCASATAQAGSLDWMAGQWCATRGSTTIEETWLPEKGGLMLGVNRMTSSKRTSFEFLRIESTGEVPEYIAQPGGAAPTRFRQVATGEQRVSFANLANDYPKRIHYRRDGEALVATIDAGSDGERAMDFRWTRCH